MTITDDQRPGMGESAMTWQVRLAVAYLRLIRLAVAHRVLTPKWAIWLTARYRQ